MNTQEQGHQDWKPGVLIVDDRAENRRMIVRALSPLDIQTYEADSGEVALDIAARQDGIFVALIDVRMPGMDGYALAEQLRRLPTTAALPIIYISAHESPDHPHSRAYETGAVDFLTKPVSPRVLLSKVRVFLDLYRQRSELQAVNASLSKQTLRLETSADVIHQIASILDIDKLLSEILSLIRDQFGYTFTGIWMLDKDSNMIMLRTGHYGTPNPVSEPGYAIPQTTTQSIIAHAYRTGIRYLSSDTRCDPHFMPVEELPGIRSELALPLRFGDTLLGILDIQSTMKGAFLQEDITALQLLADQIAVAIRNARLYAEVRRLNERLEAEVNERTQELQTAYKHLELLDHSKSDFIAVVSHELRTPLTLINGFSQMLLTSSTIIADPECYREAMGIVKGARRMHTIVDSMLDIVKIDSRTLQLTLSEVKLLPLLERLIAGLRGALEERCLSLTLVGLDALPTIEADAEELVKVFEELLTNAMKYTPDGGRIQISGRQLPRRTQDSRDYIEVTVADTGIGIPKDARELIFTKFYRTGSITSYSSGKTKFKGGGPGLGLSIARGVVEAHQGHIWADSPGHDETALPGSTFHVLLPVEQESPKAPLLKPEPDASLPCEPELPPPDPSSHLE